MANGDRRTLLRHRFDSVEQLTAHLHVAEGRGLLFFRDPALDLAAGSSVLLELTFSTSEQTRVLRASMLVRTDQGSWLVTPDIRFVREVHDRGLIARRNRRLGADLPVRIRRRNGQEYLLALLDLSIGGARLGRGLPGSLRPGTDLELTLAFPGPGQTAALGQAKVAWVEDGEAGLLFDRASSTCRVSVGRLFQSLQKEWETARTIDHLRGCCAGGALQEPPMPRLRADGKDDISRPKVG
jgi:hypothetical protein